MHIYMYIFISKIQNIYIQIQNSKIKREKRMKDGTYDG